MVCYNLGMATPRTCFLAFLLALSMGVSAASYDVAAFVWPAYQPEPRWAELGIFGDGKGEWENLYESCKRYPDDHQGVKPLWGYEDESDPVVVAHKIDAAVASGVNVFIYDWYWYGGRPFLQRALEEGFLKAANRNRMKFYVMYANHNVNRLWDNKVGGAAKSDIVWPAKITDGDWAKIVRTWIGYFREPNYYKIGGCPVLMIYEANEFVAWDGFEKAKARIDYLRAEARRAGFPGVHLQVQAWFRKAKELGVDSYTIYNWMYETWDRANSRTEPELTYAQWGDMALRNFDEAQERASGFGAQFFPNLTIGWDTNARYPSNDVQTIIHGSSPVAFEHYARRVKEWADRRIGDGLPKLITVNSWNEWTEGSYLEPDDHLGYGYLEVVRKVFNGKE